MIEPKAEPVSGGWRVTVPIPHDGVVKHAVIDVDYGPGDIYTVKVAGELLEQTPEAVAAVMAVAWREIAIERQALIEWVLRGPFSSNADAA